MSCKKLQSAMREMANPEIAAHSAGFFKTGKGEYGEGDKFLGVRVPPIRALAKQYQGISLTEILKLLKSKYHEERLLAVILMVNSYTRSDESGQSDIYHAYLDNTHLINGWDLVDSSAHQIVGGYLLDKKRQGLRVLSRSESLWERRISIIATLHYIRLKQFDDTLKISKALLKDKEDLIHKAVGWMLREVGNRDRETLEEYLLKHYKNMPRTMLRYAIEKFDRETRQNYLDGII